MILKYLIIIFLILSCSSPSAKVGEADTNNNSNDIVNKASITQQQNSNEINTNSSLAKQKIVGEFNFQLQLMEAKDFLKRKGENLNSDDLKKIKEEQVLLFEIEYLTPKANESILEYRKTELDKDETINYFANLIQNDFIITQNKKEIKTNGAYYESMFGAANKIRCVIYLSNLDLNKKFEVLFHDKIFNKGLLRFNF